MALSPSVVPQESKEDNANCVETKPSQTTSIASEDPLQNLCLASQEVLRKAQQSGRSRCRQCGGSRMFYCYTCCVPVGNVPTEQIPCVQVVLVFPGPQSISIEDVSFHLQKRIESKGRNKADNLDVPPRKLKRTTDEEGWDLHESTRQGPELKRVVFIDSTWSQTNQIASDERLRELLQVELRTRKTCFWRHQKGKPDTFLSTIEAIYYFLVDYHSAVQKEKYRGQYDNLLFFYSFMYRLIKNARGSGEKAKPQLVQ
ncbi:tRNA-uridine aminocarboxypropyltransferase 1 isoform X2 [Mus musculus]|uniref:tRNA-uridine aminocarboxypropyltransferase 1 isoform X2 n=1 Tax=Mus musculus TaxID=10090 RepID=UPI00001EF922|nr:tRNA-uridine aminocarboxypropyltransferase 1 isoform X2 [Mus musculus]XP_036018427.1 tRNA-uridine aminocarboxypropyltransferase 1 isoform X2 [Mus musculus]|eukprot:XP_006500195.1 PREDICTED: DTW domain-containing protein 1 isoform X2 [Mus musculus]